MLTLKTDRQWTAIMPGDRFARNIPIGTELPVELWEQARAARVVPPMKCIRQMNGDELEQAMDQMDTIDIAGIYCTIVRKLPTAKMSEDKMREAIFAVVDAEIDAEDASA